MCLHQVNEVYKAPESFGIGYKVFKLDTDGILKSPSSNGGDFPFMVGKWITDTYRARIRSSYDVPYDVGFHIFVSKQDADSMAKEWMENYHHTNLVVHQVYYKDVVAVGTNEVDCFGNAFRYGLCVVAKQIKVQKDN
jgi:hypothetical protein